MASPGVSAMKWDDVASPPLRPGAELSLLHHTVPWVSRASTVFWRVWKTQGHWEEGFPCRKLRVGSAKPLGLGCCPAAGQTAAPCVCSVGGLCAVLVWTTRGGLRWWLDPLSPRTAPSTCHRESVAAISVLPGCPQSGPGPLTFPSVTPHLFLFYPKPCVKGYFKKLFI